MSQKILVVLADGFEEIEAITIIDVLRRAELDVTVAGIGSNTIKGAHNITIKTDTTLDAYKTLPDALVLPGGLPGAENLKNSAQLITLIKELHKKNHLIAAICAAPAIVLTPTGILNGKKATCYPGFETQFNDQITFTEERVVKDENLITSRGPGTALEFSLEIVKTLTQPEKAQALSQGMLLKK